MAIWTFEGDYYNHPYKGEGDTGLGKPLKIMTHPPRVDIPIFIGAEGPKNIAQTVEIADGWLPLFYSPSRPEVYAKSIAGRSEDFEITVNTAIRVTGNSPEELAEALFPTKASLGFYFGGMGAKGQNYHTKLMARMGFEEEAYRIQDLFFEGRREEAIAAVPDQFADEISLVGSPERIRDRLAAWEESPVTGINVGARSADELRAIAEVILG